MCTKRWLGHSRFHLLTFPGISAVCRGHPFKVRDHPAFHSSSSHTGTSIPMVQEGLSRAGSADARSCLSSTHSPHRPALEPAAGGRQWLSPPDTQPCFWYPEMARCGSKAQPDLFHDTLIHAEGCCQKYHSLNEAGPMQPAGQALRSQDYGGTEIKRWKGFSSSCSPWQLLSPACCVVSTVTGKR